MLFSPWLPPASGNRISPVCVCVCVCVRLLLMVCGCRSIMVKGLLGRRNFTTRVTEVRQRSGVFIVSQPTTYNLITVLERLLVLLSKSSNLWFSGLHCIKHLYSLTNYVYKMRVLKVLWISWLVCFKAALLGQMHGSKV